MLMFINPKNIQILAALLCGLCSGTCRGQQKEITVKVENEGRTYYGQPLGWDGKQIALLRLDGQLSLFTIRPKKDVEVVASDFKPYSLRQLKTRLQKEFGDRYDVSTTTNFVVVHPAGKSEIWAKPFEIVFARFEYFFRKQGVPIARSKFPLIAIVLRSRKDFDRYMHNEAKIHDARVRGFYSHRTNRLVTYDPSSKLRTADKSWLYRSPTVVHEAAHQAAFNLGLHNRFAPPPLWIAEGLAMLFEARGYNNAKKFGKFKDRINRQRLKVLQKHYREGNGDGMLTRLIVDEKWAMSDPKLAYAVAWGAAFYLAETDPEAFFAYLKRDAARRAFVPYPAARRLKDFSNAFGDLSKLEQSMKEYFLGGRMNK